MTAEALLWWAVFLPVVAVGYALRSAVAAWRQVTRDQRQIDELARARRIRQHHRAPGGAA